MERRTFWITLSVLLAIMAAMIWLNAEKANKTEGWAVEYEMVNRNIEWTGAGYNGIYER